MKLIKTDIEGYYKSNNAVVSTDQDALEAYKRRKKIYKSADDIEMLKKQILELQKQVNILTEKFLYRHVFLPCNK